jgi:ankyrin repeat protein
MYASFVGLFFYSYISAMEQLEKKKGCADLFKAIEIDDRETVADIITTNVRCLYKSHKADGFFEKVTSLHVAAYHGRNTCLKMLLDHVDANISNKYEYAPLHYVRNIKTAQILEKKGAFVDKQASNGATPFMCAVKSQLFEVAEFFLEKKADINDVDSVHSNSALHTAVIARQPQAVEFLLAHSADANKQNNYGRTAFDMVLQEIEKDNIQEIRQIFRKYGMIFFPGMRYNMLFSQPQESDDKVLFYNNWARMLIGAQNVDQKVTDLLYKQICTTQGIIINKHGLIINCVSSNQLNNVFGREFVANIKICLNRLIYNAFEYVQYNNYHLLAKLIKTYPSIINYNAFTERSIMLMALGYKDLKCLDILLKNGIDVHQCVVDHSIHTCDVDGTYLHQAVFCDNPDAIKLLLDYGIDYLLRDISGQTAMQYAVQLKRNDCIAQLNQWMCQRFVKELHRKNYKKCKQLLLQITDYNTPICEKETLLYGLLGEKNIKKRNKYILFLKDKKTDFNKICNNLNNTPLQVAFSEDKRDLCEILLDAGADPDITYTRSIVLRSAISKKNLGLLILLLRYNVFIKDTWVAHCLKNFPSWPGTPLLQEAYDKQEQKRKEQKFKEIEEANQAIAKSCCVCLEEKNAAKNVSCSSGKDHDATIICEECCQALRKMNQPCPICRAAMIFEK